MSAPNQDDTTTVVETVGAPPAQRRKTVQVVDAGATEVDSGATAAPGPARTNTSNMAVAGSRPDPITPTETDVVSSGMGGGMIDDFRRDPERMYNEKLRPHARRLAGCGLCGITLMMLPLLLLLGLASTIAGLMIRCAHRDQGLMCSRPVAKW